MSYTTTGAASETAFAIPDGSPRRLVLEIDGDLLPPLRRAALGFGVQPGRARPVAVHERDRCEADLEQARDMTDERPRDPDLVARAHQLLRDGRDRLELAIADGDALLRLERPADAARHQAALAPPHQQQRGRDDRKDDRDERRPHVAGHRPLVAQHEDTEDRRRRRDRGKDEHDAPVDQVRAGAQAPELGQHRPRHGRVRGREQEQRDGIEEHRFGGVTHRRPGDRTSRETTEPAARGDDTAGSS
jgi:hypothetical protein